MPPDRRRGRAERLRQPIRPRRAAPPLAALPRELSPAEHRIAEAANEFAFDLMRELTGALPADSNAFLSPISASMALATALNGGCRTAPAGAFRGSWKASRWTRSSSS